MANNIQAQVAGGEMQTDLSVGTVKDLAEMIGASNHSAVVNGSPVEDDYVLEDYNHVSFAPKVKGA